MASHTLTNWATAWVPRQLSGWIRVFKALANMHYKELKFSACMSDPATWFCGGGGGWGGGGGKDKEHDI